MQIIMWRIKPAVRNKYKTNNTILQRYRHYLENEMRSVGEMGWDRRGREGGGQWLEWWGQIELKVDIRWRGKCKGLGGLEKVVAPHPASRRAMLPALSLSFLLLGPSIWDVRCAVGGGVWVQET